MSAQFLIPPTYAPPFIRKPDAKDDTETVINPVWLNWFLTVSQVIAPTSFDHQNLSSLQGGSTSERYHLTQAQHNGVTAGPATPVATPAVGASPWVYQNTSDFTQLVIAVGGTGVVFDYSVDNSTFFAIPAGASVLGRTHYLRVTYATAPVVSVVSL